MNEFFKTRAGYEGLVSLFHGHWNGYVRVPQNHPLYRVPYNIPHPALQKSRVADSPVGKRGVIPLFCAQDSEELAGDLYFDVHGSLTFSGPRMGDCKGDDWWFGFDTAHCDDTPENCPKEYVIEQVEHLAVQLFALEGNTFPPKDSGE
jgi:hypothetical protein